MNGQVSATVGSLLAAMAAVGALSCGSRADDVPVRLRIWQADTAVAQVRLATGVEGTVTVEGGGSLRLTPSLRSGVVTLGVGRTGLGARPARNAPEVLLRLTSSQRMLIPGSGFAVEWLAREPIASGAPNPTACSHCCMTCAGVTVCACSVTMACGECACEQGCTASVGQIAPLVQSRQVLSVSAVPPPTAEKTASGHKRGPTERPVPAGDLVSER